jgi:hypothetical protein
MKVIDGYSPHFTYIKGKAERHLTGHCTLALFDPNNFLLTYKSLTLPETYFNARFLYENKDLSWSGYEDQKLIDIYVFPLETSFQHLMSF